MVDYKYLRASDGTGNAALAHISTPRTIGSTTLDVDSVDNWPPFFICVTGLIGSDGFLVPASITEFRGHLTGGDITIDAFEPGSTDVGNTTDQVAIIKQVTGFADRVVENALVAHNENGTIKNGAVSATAMVADNIITKPKLAADARPGLRPYSIASTATLAPNVDNYTSYEVTAQAAALSISNPTGTVIDKAVIMFFIKDNGTARAITWGTEYSNISGLDSLTTTVINKWSVVGCVYNAAVSKWQIVSISTEA